METPQPDQLHIDLNRKLLKRYADIRRDEQTVITELVETLESVDDLPAKQIDQVRDALFHTDFPFLMVLVGPFSSGKSSIINALLGQSILDVGAIPTTDHIHILRYGSASQSSRTGERTTVFHPHPLLESLSFVDTPGLESVFDKHDQVTRSFLHRADLVLLVMVATHVMSASDLSFMQELRDYGKRMIIVINQIDVLEDDDRSTVREFVAEQSRLHLGTTPTIWAVSAKQAMEAQAETPRDEILYDTSGFAEVEEYIQETLNDVERIKQKLTTSLQIASNVRIEAAKLVTEKSEALSVHRKSLNNIKAQTEEAIAVQQRNADDGINEVNQLWAEATERGSEAIRELFGFSRAFGQIFAGIGELIGLAALIRRFGRRTRAQQAFQKHDVIEEIAKIPDAVDKIGARLEGRDVVDLDELVAYTQTQIEALPPNLKDKVIGKVQSPMNYDRSFLRQRRDKLENILAQARQFETDKLDRNLRTMLVVLGFWELVVVAMTLVVGVTAASTMDAPTIFAFFGVALLVGLAGMLLLPIRGWFFERAYSRRMFDLKEQYLKILREALQEIVNYGSILRRDTALPYTRLIESQTENTNALKRQLDDAEGAIQRVQRGIGTL